jgi:hypothetical protein
VRFVSNLSCGSRQQKQALVEGFFSGAIVGIFMEFFTDFLIEKENKSILISFFHFPKQRESLCSLRFLISRAFSPFSCLLINGGSFMENQGIENEFLLIKKLNGVLVSTLKGPLREFVHFLFPGQEGILTCQKGIFMKNLISF